MKVTIERESCTQCTLCWVSCPEYFEESPEDGFCQIVEQYRIDDQIDQGTVPESLSECVNAAADDCPVEIIHVEET